MRITVLAFFIAVFATMHAPQLPPAAWAWLYGLLAVTSLLAAFIWVRVRWLAGLLGLLAGSLWVLFYVHSWGPPTLPESLEWQEVSVNGYIDSIPDCNERRCRFDYVIEEMPGVEQSWLARVRLSWYRPRQQLVAGQRWQFRVKLKRPHGFANPGGFDYEAWLYESGIAATGYVRQPEQAKLLGSETTLNQLRQQLGQRFKAALRDASLSGVLLALVNGDRQHIDPDQWQVFTRTGTIHLMAISGLHIGLVFGLFFWLGRYLWSARANLCLLRPAQDVGAVTGLIAAIVYAAMAGFAIPTQRALIMLSVVTLVLLLRRVSSVWDVLLLALLVVLLLDPTAVLATGFWLSFLAVAVILTVVMRQSEPVEQQGMLAKRAGQGRRWLSRLLVIQLVLAFGLLPVLAIFFNQVSWISPLANLIAVPWVSLLVVPLVLIGTGLLMVWPAGGTGLLELALWLMEVLWQLLSELADLSWAVLHVAQPDWWIIVLAVAGILIALFLKSSMPVARWRWLGLVLVVPLLGWSPPRLPSGSYQVDVLDVGQGLSVLIRTQDHSLLFDTGFSSGREFDMGERVILPYLHHQGVKQLDTLIVSHDDKDHAGGLASLMKTIPVNRLLLGQDSHHKTEYVQAELCHAGQHWQWDGVTFEILHPDDRSWKKQNNRSCVLRIDNGQRATLITADIESKVEQYLMTSQPDKLASDILLVPHHGSKSSSSADFLAVVDPQIAVHTVGYRNRFKHPHPTVSARYRQQGIQQYRSDQDGRVSIQIAADSSPVAVMTYRRSQPRFWRYAASAQQ